MIGSNPQASGRGEKRTEDLLPVRLDPNRLRRSVLEMAQNGNSVHIACAFSLIEIFSSLYSHRILSFDQKSPMTDDRDRLVLSKGHGVMALYAVFRELKWIQERDIENYFHDGSRLHGLCEPEVPGLEVAGGSLGHGIAVGVGMAYALKKLGKQQRVICICGDGELNEGSVWESLLFAGHHRLDNLTVIVDANGYQAMGETRDIIDLEPLLDKMAAFRWSAWDIDGHSIENLHGVYDQILETQGVPTAIIARTRKGQGVSFMANNNEWHYRRLDDELYKKALEELT